MLPSKKLNGITLHSKEQLRYAWEKHAETQTGRFSWNQFFSKSGISKLDLFESLYQLLKRADDRGSVIAMTEQKLFKQQLNSFNTYCKFRGLFDELPLDFTWKDIETIYARRENIKPTFKNVCDGLGLTKENLGFEKTTDALGKLPLMEIPKARQKFQ